MNLYFGGYGDYMEFTVADSEAEAIAKIGVKINAPHLPIAAKVIDDIDGYKITAAESEEKAPKIMHCKHCDYETDNLGALSQHYRAEHPKNKGA